MSFTDQKPQVATAEHCNFRWDGNKRNFRCYLCGHKFRIGDTWRWVYGNSPRDPVGNFLVCKACDGADVVARYRALRDEWAMLSRGKMWHFVQQAKLEGGYETLDHQAGDRP